MPTQEEIQALIYAAVADGAASEPGPDGMPSAEARERMSQLLAAAGASVEMSLSLASERLPEFAYGTEPPGPGWEFAGEMKWVRRSAEPQKPPEPREGSPRIAVIGGGPAGLFTTYILNQRLPDASVTILEASDRLGGKIRTDFFKDGTPFEAGVAELYEYLGPGGKDPLRSLIEDDLGLPTKDMQGGAVYVQGKLCRDLKELGEEFGYATKKRVEAFHAKMAELMPLEKYANRWQPDNEHLWADKTFHECIVEELGDDPAARAYVEAAIHSDLATEPWTCHGLNGIKNGLMDNPEYMRLYHISGGIGRLAQELAERIEADVNVGCCVERVEKSGEGYAVYTRQCESIEGFDAVVVAMPNHWLNQLRWTDKKVAAAIQAILAHYDLPAHYLRVSFEFKSRWWADLDIPGDYWMMDVLHGCCVYDESFRWSAKDKHVLAFLIAGQDALNLCSFNQTDEDIARHVLDALPHDWRDRAAPELVESRVERYVGSLNACPGGWPAPDIEKLHQPEPSGHPGLFLVGDYFFDSTLNACLISAGTAVTRLIDALGLKAKKGTKAVQDVSGGDL